MFLMGNPGFFFNHSEIIRKRNCSVFSFKLGLKINGSSKKYGFFGKVDKN
jgi:hypothetical protein